jgi:hypothetical protein
MGKFVSHSNDLWQQNLFKYRATQFPEAIGFATHTLVTVRVGNSVVIPFAKYLTERERKVEKRKECLVPRQRTE